MHALALQFLRSDWLLENLEEHCQTKLPPWVGRAAGWWGGGVSAADAVLPSAKDLGRTQPDQPLQAAAMGGWGGTGWAGGAAVRPYPPGEFGWDAKLRYKPALPSPFAPLQDSGNSPTYSPSLLDYFVLRAVSSRRLPYNAAHPIPVVGCLSAAEVQALSMQVGRV